MRNLFDRRLKKPKVSIVLLDWNCRESFHIFDYLPKQTAARDEYEIIWIEYYQRCHSEIKTRLDKSLSSGNPILDQWIVMGMPENVYYHKHLMYNLGIATARGEIVVIMDSDAFMKPTFVETVINAFKHNPNIVLHIDEVRNVNRQYYPFNNPSFEDLLGEGCINFQDGKTTGLHPNNDFLHSVNYGACMCARRDDLIAIGGADEHIDYLGHVCGPYDMTFRLVNAGKKEIWHESEFIYHTWHPGTDGENNYLGPHDGKNVSSLALEAVNTKRIYPILENIAIKSLREKAAPLPFDAVIDASRVKNWVICDDMKNISLGRSAYYRADYVKALTYWGKVGANYYDNSLLADIGWAYHLTGNADAAREAFDKVLRENPDFLLALHGRGWVKLAQQKPEQALSDFSAAYRVNKGRDTGVERNLYRGLGWAYFHLNDFRPALKNFQCAYELADRSDKGFMQDVLRGLGWVQHKENDRAKAKKYFIEALTYIVDKNTAEGQDALNGLKCASFVSAVFLKIKGKGKSVFNFLRS